MFLSTDVLDIKVLAPRGHTTSHRVLMEICKIDGQSVAQWCFNMISVLSIHCYKPEHLSLYIKLINTFWILHEGQHPLPFSLTDTDMITVEEKQLIANLIAQEQETGEDDAWIKQQRNKQTLTKIFKIGTDQL